MSKGAFFPEHTHKEHEWLIIYEGKLKVNVDCGSKIFGVGDMVYFAPEQAHSIKALEKTWIIGTTIPASEGYPDKCN